MLVALLTIVALGQDDELRPLPTTEQIVEKMHRKWNSTVSNLNVVRSLTSKTADEQMINNALTRAFESALARYEADPASLLHLDVEELNKPGSYGFPQHRNPKTHKLGPVEFKIVERLPDADEGVVITWDQRNPPPGKRRGRAIRYALIEHEATTLNDGQTFKGDFAVFNGGVTTDAEGRKIGVLLTIEKQVEEAVAKWKKDREAAKKK